jgi:hypothetical protein
MLEVGAGRHADAAGAGPEPVSLVVIASPARKCCAKALLSGQNWRSPVG